MNPLTARIELAMSSASALGKYRYTVWRVTPSLRATSARRNEAPCSATCSSTAVRIRDIASSSVAGVEPAHPRLRIGCHEPFAGELDRQSRRTGHSQQRLPRCRTSAMSGAEAASEYRERLGQFTPCQVRPEAVVRATAEGQNCGDVLTRDVEAVSIVVDRWISVGRKGVREHEGTCREPVATELDVLDGDPRHDAGRR